MMKTKITCDWIDRYNNGELTGAERAAMHHAMMANPLLRAEVLMDARLDRFLEDGEMVDLMEKSRSVSEKRGSRGIALKPLLIAASVLFLVVSGGFFYLLRDKPAGTRGNMVQPHATAVPNTPGKPITADYRSKFLTRPEKLPMPAYQPTHHILLAQNFEPLEELEAFVGVSVRSVPFRLKSPGVKLSVASGTDVLFSWQPCSDRHKMTIVLLNNKGVRVFCIHLNGASSCLLPTKGIAAGLYYWKILSDGDLVLMGRLTIL